MKSGSVQTAFNRVRLQNFRSYKECDVSLDAGLVALVGPNGAGKTNFLEALSLFAPGRGLRNASLQELGFTTNTKQGPSSAWAVSARYSNGGLTHQIGTGLDQPGSTRRQLRHNGKPLKGQIALPRLLSIIWLTPRMDGLFVGPASERRGMLDQMVLAVQPDHGSELAAYVYAMKERGRLLRKASNQGQTPDNLWLEKLEDSMARHGLAIAAARRETVALLGPLFEQGFGGFPSGTLTLSGWFEEALDNQKALELEDDFKQRLAKERQPRASMGPHTSDIAFVHGSTGRAAAQASTGEQKALLVSLLLSFGSLQSQQYVSPGKPIFLLDEVAAHFDEKRRHALFEALAAEGIQAIMTGTDASLFKAEKTSTDIQLLTVEDAAIRS